MFVAGTPEPSSTHALWQSPFNRHQQRTYSLLFQTLLNPIIYVHFDLTINPFDLTINLLDLTINLHDLTINLKDLTINLFDLTINHLYIRGQNLGFVVIRSV